jgi:hypothetical protein
MRKGPGSLGVTGASVSLRLEQGGGTLAAFPVSRLDLLGSMADNIRCESGTNPTRRTPTAYTEPPTMRFYRYQTDRASRKAVP